MRDISLRPRNKMAELKCALDLAVATTDAIALIEIKKVGLFKTRVQARLLEGFKGDLPPQFAIYVEYSWVPVGFKSFSRGEKALVFLSSCLGDGLRHAHAMTDRMRVVERNGVEFAVFYRFDAAPDFMRCLDPVRVNKFEFIVKWQKLRNYLLTETARNLTFRDLKPTEPEQDDEPSEADIEGGGNALRKCDG